MELRMEMLKDGLRNTLSVILQDSQNFMNFQNKTNLNMKKLEENMYNIEKYLGNVSNKILEENIIEHELLMAILEIQYETVRNSIKITKLFEKQSVINACKQNQIPSVILKPEILMQNLKKLEKMNKAWPSLTLIF